MSKKEYDANKLFQAGGILLFFDVPYNSEFGIDYNSWRTGENFKGLKMIPPGLHYIYFSVADKYGNVGLRNGFFHNFKLKQIVAKKWNKQTEKIEDYELNEDQLINFDQNKREFDKFLGAYPYEEFKRWVSLTNHIDYEFLTHLLPENKIISSGSSLIGQKFSKSRFDHNAETKEIKDNFLKIPINLKDAESRLPEMKLEKGSDIRFSEIPSQSFPAGSKPSEVTNYSIDLSYRLEHLIKKQLIESNKTEPVTFNLLGEIQFAFICFLIGHVYHALEQWKLLISLLCNSESLIKKYPNLFIQFIQVIYFQLKEMPDDFFTDIMTSNNFLVVNFHNFFDNIKDCNKQETSKDASDLMIKLNEKCEKFKNYLKEKFQYDFEIEPDEYAPVICEDL